MAEQRFLRLSPPGKDDLQFVLSAVRAGRGGTGDEGEVFRSLEDQFPEADDDQLIKAFNAYQHELAKLLDEDDRLWQRIQRPARALWEEIALTADQVEEILS